MLTSDRVLVDSPTPWLLWLLRYPRGDDSRKHREHGLCLVSLGQHPGPSHLGVTTYAYRSSLAPAESGVTYLMRITRSHPVGKNLMEI